MRSTKKSTAYLLMQDICIILFSIFVAVFISRSQILARLLTSTEEVELVGSFIAGLFFTSLFTTAPAIVALGEIAQAHSLFWTAILGGAGAVVGDMVIFRFIRDRFSEHLTALARERGFLKRAKIILQSRILRRSSLFVGGLILASPLPDELGISILGLAHVSTRWFVPISFLFNALGILIIGVVARAL